MNLDGDKLYMKIVDLDEIYNFVVKFFYSALGGTVAMLSPVHPAVWPYRQLNWRQEARSVKKNLQYIFLKNQKINNIKIKKTPQGLTPPSAGWAGGMADEKHIGIVTTRSYCSYQPTKPAIRTGSELPALLGLMGGLHSG